LGLLVAGLRCRGLPDRGSIQLGGFRLCSRHLQQEASEKTAPSFQRVYAGLGELPNNPDESLLTRLAPGGLLWSARDWDRSEGTAPV